MKNKRKFLITGYDVVVFDCDSTLTKIEGIDFLAERRGKGKEVKTLTNKTMNGEIVFDKVFAKRLDLIKPKRQDLIWLGEEYIKYQVKDGRKTIKLLKELGKKVYIVTGGYRQAVEIFAQYLGIPKKNVFAVELKFGKDGNYLNFNLKNPLTKRGGKRKVLRNLARKGKTIFVGDGATDLEAKDVVDLFVGFGGVVVRPVVRERADIFINKKGLSPVLVLASGLG